MRIRTGDRVSVAGVFDVEGTVVGQSSFVDRRTYQHGLVVERVAARYLVRTDDGHELSVPGAMVSTLGEEA